jgi:hypothetical protein
VGVGGLDLERRRVQTPVVVLWAGLPFVGEVSLGSVESEMELRRDSRASSSSCERVTLGLPFALARLMRERAFWASASWLR